MKAKCAQFFLVSAVALTLCGCASYYKVTDPASGRTYYTHNLDHKRNGVIRFKDGATRSQVTLSSSEVIKITRDQYKAATQAK